MSTITINAEERAEIIGALWQWTDGETVQFKTRGEAAECRRSSKDRQPPR